MVKQTEQRKQTELNHKQLEKLLLLKTRIVRCAAMLVNFLKLSQLY